MGSPPMSVEDAGEVNSGFCRKKGREQWIEVLLVLSLPWLPPSSSLLMQYILIYFLPTESKSSASYLAPGMVSSNTGSAGLPVGVTETM